MSAPVQANITWRGPNNSGIQCEAREFANIEEARRLAPVCGRTHGGCSVHYVEHTGPRLNSMAKAPVRAYAFCRHRRFPSRPSWPGMAAEGRTSSSRTLCASPWPKVFNGSPAEARQPGGMAGGASWVAPPDTVVRRATRYIRRHDTTRGTRSGAGHHRGSPLAGLVRPAQRVRGRLAEGVTSIQAP